MFQSLLEGLDEVNSDLWRDVISLQANWIGSSDGVRFVFPLQVCFIVLLYLFNF